MTALALGMVRAAAVAPAVLGAAAVPGTAVPPADPRLGIHVTDQSPDVPRHTFGVERLWDSGAIWCRMNPAPGVWDFSPLLSQLDAAAGRGAHTAIVVLGFPPAHAVADIPAAAYPAEAGWLCPDQGFASLLPSDAAWDDYVTRITDQVATWRAAHPQVAVQFQVWNEPAVGWFLRPDQDPRRLVALAARARTIVGQRAPGALVISPSIVVNTSPHRERWQRRFVSATTRWSREHAQRLFDVWAIHLYPTGNDLQQLWGAERGYLAIMNDLTATIAPGRQPGDQVWVTEINANVWITAPPVQVLSSADQAAFVHMVALDTAARGIPVVVWYRWHYDPWQHGNGQIVFSPESPLVTAWRG